MSKKSTKITRADFAKVAGRDVNDPCLDKYGEYWGEKPKKATMKTTSIDNRIKAIAENEKIEDIDTLRFDIYLTFSNFLHDACIKELTLQEVSDIVSKKFHKVADKLQ